jgi:hypothetical protein
MRKLLSVLVVSAALALPLCTRAQQTQASHAPRQTGLTLGVRLALGVPLGTAYVAYDPDGYPFDLSFNDVLSASVPIWLEAGYRFSPSFLLGAYVQIAPASVARNTCVGGCSGSDQRLGIEGIYHFLPREKFNPWVGLGIGYEWANYSFGEDSYGLRGFEVLNLQAGGDFALSPAARLGPFMMISLGRFATATSSTPGVTVIEDIPSNDTRTHGWLQIGVKGTFDL